MLRTAALRNPSQDPSPCDENDHEEAATVLVRLLDLEMTDDLAKEKVRRVYCTSEQRCSLFC